MRRENEKETWARGLLYTFFFFSFFVLFFFFFKTKQNKTKKTVGYSEYPGKIAHVIEYYPPISRWTELVRSFVLIIMMIIVIIIYSHFNRYELNSM